MIINKSYYYGSALLTLSALLLSIVITPNGNEVALMQLEDGNLQAAFKKYKSEEDKGHLSMDVVSPLSKLYVQYGDVDSAILMMERFVKKHPSSVDARTQLGLLYQSAQRLDEYLASLKILATMAPSHNVLRDIVKISDFLLDDDARLEALQKLTSNKAYKATEKDYQSLAYLLADKGKYRAAADTMKLLLEGKKYAVSTDSVLLAMQLFMDSKDFTHAFNIASLYLDKHHNGDIVAKIATGFRTAERVDLAYGIVKPWEKLMKSSLALTEETVVILLAQGKDDEVISLINAHLQTEQTLPGSLSTTLVELLLKKKDYAALEALVDTISLTEVPENTLMECAEIAIIEQKPHFAAKLAINLGDEFLTVSPAVAVLIKVAEQPSAQAKSALVNLQTQVLTSAQKLVLLRVYSHLNLSSALQTLAKSLPMDQLLDNLDSFAIAGIYLDSGQVETGINVLSATPHQSYPRKTTEKIDKALVLLAAGSGNEELFYTKIQKVGISDTALLADSYSLAEQHKHTSLILIIARMIYANKPTPRHRLQLAEALLTNSLYTEALAELSPLLKEEAPNTKNYTLASHYLEAASNLIRDHKLEPLNADREAFLLAVHLLLASETSTRDEKFDGAYMLAKTGHTKEAEEVFMQLASDKNPTSQEVETLLALAGANPSETIIAWVKKRAEGAEGKDLALWLATLNTMHKTADVAALIGNKPNSLNTPAVADVYIESLITLKDKNTLATVLEAELEKGTNPARHRELTMLAVDYGFANIAEKGLHYLISIAPEDKQAVKQLGMLYLSQGNSTKAEPQLQRYLTLEKDDYEATYNYAELLWQQQAYDQAKQYYAIAAQQIEALPHKNFSTRMMEAHLLYRQQSVQEAMDYYRHLLEEQPDNKSLRAEFADMLIETKRLDEAKKVLME